MTRIAQWSRRKLLKTGAIAVPVGLGLAGCGDLFAPAAGSDAAALQERLSGTVVVRGQPSYEEWRKAMIWQFAKADRHPDMIVQVDTVADVQEAVRYAAERNMKVTTRGGGHSMAACFLRNSGMLIDVSRLDGIAVDGANKSAVAGPGVICRGLAEELAKHDLAFPGAHCGTVPISGYLLGGGVGLNTNSWSQGLSVFAVKGVDIVTADGELRHASATENPELFWAARGGGPGLFGVVTNFHLACFDAPKVIWGATYVFPYDELRAVTDVMRDVVPALDKRVEVMYSVAPDPEAAPELPYAERQLIYLDINAFAQSEAEGRRMIEPLTRHPLAGRSVAAITDRAGSFDRYYSDNEAGFPQTHWMGDDIWADDPDAVREIFEKVIPETAAPRAIPIMLYTGEHKGEQPDAAASTFGRYYVAYYMEWDEPGEEQASREFCHRVFQEMKQVSSGSYINEMDQEGRPEDISTCYSPQAWTRLGELRRKWDPDGVFHDFYGQSGDVA